MDKSGWVSLLSSCLTHLQRVFTKKTTSLFRQGWLSLEKRKPSRLHLSGIYLFLSFPLWAQMFTWKIVTLTKSLHKMMASCSLRSYNDWSYDHKNTIALKWFPPPLFFHFWPVLEGSFEMMTSPAQPNLFGKVLILVNNPLYNRLQLFTDIEVQHWTCSVKNSDFILMV